jgi:hypothetical protein
MTFQRARVAVLSGPRAMCNLVASAGLGITGAGTWSVFTVDYKPGETVTPERVSKAFDAMAAESSKAGTPLKILKHALMDITTVEDAP